jgi:ribosome-associated protein
MLQVTPTLAIPEAELEERFIRAPGPGGQNVNKVATAVMLRFDAARSTVLSEAVRARLVALAGRRLTDDGVVVIVANRHRTQVRNREDARARLAELLARAAAPPPPPRRATRPGRAAVARRLEAKARDGARKAMRRTPPAD